MKKNRMLRLLSTLLVAILIITVAPVNDVVLKEMKNSANGVLKNIGEIVENVDFSFPGINLKAEASVDNIEWRFDGETLIISGSGEIPEDYYTNGEWTEIRDKCINVRVEGDITVIDDNVFRNFAVLKRVEILSCLETIGPWAFANCTSLEEIYLPDSVTRIYDKAFLNCTSLKSFDFPENLERIYEWAFENCQCFDGKELVLPDSLKAVGKGAFSGANITSLKAPFVGYGPESWAVIGTYNIGSMFGDKSFSDTYTYSGIQPQSSEKYYVPNSLKEVTITKYIYYNNFENASKIEKIVIKDTVETTEYPSGFVKNCSALKDLILENRQDIITHIGYGAFQNCTSLKNFVIPENVTKIAGYAFYNCKFKNIILSEKLEEIGEYAFYGSVFDNIIIPETVKKIGAYAFAYCKNIESVVIPDSVTSIGDYAFKNCSDLKNVKLSDNISSMGKGVFEGTLYIEGITEDFIITENGVLIEYLGEATNVIVPDGVTRLGAAFAGRGDIKTITLPDGLLYISKDCFKNCSGLTELIIPDTLLEIETDAFNGCCNIKELVIPDTVVKIGYKAFAGMCSLEKLTVPFVGNSRDVESNSYEALIAYWFDTRDTYLDTCHRSRFSYVVPTYKDLGYKCYSYTYKPSNFKELTVTGGTLRSYALNNFELDILRLGENVEAIEEHAADSLGLKELYLHEDAKFTEIPDYAFTDNSITSISIPKNVKKIGEAFGSNKLSEINLNEGLEVIKGSFVNAKITSIDLPDSLIEIGERSFAFCTKLEYVEFPENLTQIGLWAFQRAGLKEIVFPESITYISRGAFQRCPLKKIVVPESVASIVDETFWDCADLEIVVIGGNVEAIGSLAFADCPTLETVVIPDSVMSISADAFENANENLVIYCNEGSYAEQFAIDNNIKYTTLVIEPIANQVYTGKEITPEVNASVNNRKLTQETEYTVSYKDNINAGSAKVIAKGLGDFKHLVATAKFTILPKGTGEINVLNSGSTYSPGGVKPEIYVFCGSEMLVEGQDYEILDNPVLRDVGEYNIAVSLIGNYDGVVNATYRIAPKPITRLEIEYGANVTVTHDGVALKEGKDYIVTKETKDNGDVVTIVEGIGNYTGTDTYTEENSSQVSFGWFESIINAIKRLFESLFNISI